MQDVHNNHSMFLQHSTKYSAHSSGKIDDPVELTKDKITDESFHIVDNVTSRMESC